MAKQGCDNDCMTCPTQQQSCCAVLMAKKNQELLMAIATALDPIVREVTLVAPNLGGEEVPEKTKK
nr:MAG TPA: hypothetical protein [Caudoviricetes sp.]